MQSSTGDIWEDRRTCEPVQDVRILHATDGVCTWPSALTPTHHGSTGRVCTKFVHLVEILFFSFVSFQSSQPCDMIFPHWIEGKSLSSFLKLRLLASPILKIVFHCLLLLKKYENLVYLPRYMYISVHVGGCAREGVGGECVDVRGRGYMWQ